MSELGIQGSKNIEIVEVQYMVIMQHQKWKHERSAFLKNLLRQTLLWSNLSSKSALNSHLYKDNDELDVIFDLFTALLFYNDINTYKISGQ